MAELVSVPGKKHPVRDETERCAECGKSPRDADAGVLCDECRPQAMTSETEFGIVANIAETDSALRLGAKAWVLSGWAGGGYERLQVTAITRGGRYVEKWIPITRLSNFRAAWIPMEMRPRFGGFCAMSKEEASAIAADLETASEQHRSDHPNRLAGQSAR